MEDHDQRFKVLIPEALPEFLDLFFPEWKAKLDLSSVEWMSQEVFFDPPSGEKGAVDLVAKVRTIEPLDPLRPGETASCFLLIHIEVESRDSAASFRSRMFDYYVHLRRSYNIPVLPVALFLRVGLDGVGWDAHEEVLWGKRVLRFEYAYVGLPALDGVPYLRGENLLGVALSALMKLPSEKRAELKAEAMSRIEQAEIHKRKQYYLADCLETYFPLSDADAQEYQRLIAAEPYEGVNIMGKGWIEQGIEQGLQQGRDAKARELLLRLVEKHFGVLSEPLRQRIAGLSVERVDDLILSVSDAKSLGELGLEN